MIKPEFPTNKAGSLIKDAWIKVYNEDGGTGDVEEWALAHAVTDNMKFLIKRAFAKPVEWVKTRPVEGGQ